MKTATDVRVGNVIRSGGKSCKVISQEVRGTGKFGKTVHLKVKGLEDGNMQELSVRAEDKVEDIELARVKMQYLYKDQSQYVFMNTETYEQFFLSEKVIGSQGSFLKENSEIDILFEGEKPLSIDFPKIAELKVVSTTPPAKGARAANYKEAELENGLKLLVPPFIKEGDSVRVDVETSSYLDRVVTKNFGGGQPERASKTNE